MKLSRYISITISLLIFSSFNAVAQPNSFLQKGDSLVGAKEYEKAVGVYRLVLAESGKTESHAVTKTLFKIANIHLIQQNYDSALAYYDSVISSPKTVESLQVIASAHNNSAHIHSIENRPFQSVQSGQEALAIYQATGIDSLVAMGHFNLGLSYKKISAYEQATNYIFEAIKILEARGQEYILDKAYQLLGNVLREQGKYVESIEFNKKAIEMRFKAGNMSKLSSSYNNLGNTYKMMKEYNNAIKYYTKSLRIKDSISSSAISKSRVFSNLGEAYLQIGDYEKALHYLTKSLKAKTGSDDKIGIAYVQTQLGELCIKKGELDKALMYLDSSLILSNDLGLLTIKEENLKLHNLAYYAKGEVTTAYSFLQKYISVHDSLFNEKSARNSDALRIGYEVDKKQQELISLYKDNEVQQLKFKQQSLTNKGLILLIILLFVLTVLLFYAFNLSKKNAGLQQSLLVDAQHRTKNFLQTLISLFSFQASNIEDPKAKAAVKEGEGRVNAMMMIHQHFSKPSLKNTLLNFSDYATDLIHQLKHSFQKPGVNTKLKLQIDPIELEAYQSTPLALILNELVSNALKYASSNELNTIQVSLSRSGTNELHLQVKDNGPGLPEHFEVETLQSSGMKLIRLFVKQLKGNYKFENQNGLVCNVLVKI